MNSMALRPKKCRTPWKVCGTTTPASPSEFLCCDCGFIATVARASKQRQMASRRPKNRVSRCHRIDPGCYTPWPHTGSPDTKLVSKGIEELLQAACVSFFCCHISSWHQQTSSFFVYFSMHMPRTRYNSQVAANCGSASNTDATDVTCVSLRVLPVIVSFILTTRKRETITGTNGTNRFNALVRNSHFQSVSAVL